MATHARQGLDELRDGPPTLDLPVACKWIGISRSHGYQMAKTGELPVRVIKVGGRYKVVTASLIALLAEPDALPKVAPQARTA